MPWLSDAIEAFPLTPDVEEYLYSRGAKDESLQEMGIRTWTALPEAAPDPTFCKRYGNQGGRLAGMLVCPLRSPRGSVLGFEARSTTEKKVSRYLLPEAAWNPVWVGMVPSVMRKIWEGGGDLWVVEGLFDLFPLEWVIPSSDVVLGSGRAKLTDSHAEFLRRFCRGWVNLVYDNDPVGQKGMRGWEEPDTGKRHWGAKDVLDRVGVRCRIFPYSGGKDPGDLWKAGGVRALEKAFRF
jgi:hypothetical protein